MLSFQDYILEYNNSKNLIIVDIQPAYADFLTKTIDLEDFAKYLSQSTGKILLFVNADESGLSEDSYHEILSWYEELFDAIDEPYSNNFVKRLSYYDKGYGYLRGWMDEGVDDSVIIKAIRKMYKEKVTSSDDLFDGDINQLEEFLDYDGLPQDTISVEWLSIAQLKKFSGSYIAGGGKNECLKEVQLMMSAFNIKATELSDFIY